eukprot:GHVS01056713.1.p1 GENE.GHVS01056713.1~~GHVS01056713.1.p1  ORF type:complete len:220 (-),score=66.29 GHVS01056713.1:767-1327(-)
MSSAGVPSVDRFDAAFNRCCRNVRDRLRCRLKNATPLLLVKFINVLCQPQLGTTPLLEKTLIEFKRRRQQEQQQQRQQQRQQQEQPKQQQEPTRCVNVYVDITNICLKELRMFPPFHIRHHLLKSSSTLTKQELQLLLNELRRSLVPESHWSLADHTQTGQFVREALLPRIDGVLLNKPTDIISHL